MPSLFVTATGTDIGKTFISSLMLRQLTAKGHTPFALKPVISGFDAGNPTVSDTGILIKAMGKNLDAALIERISPWRFREPISPHLAAKAVFQTLKASTLADYCRSEINQHTMTLVEGAGGLMAPLNDTETMRDWIAALRIPFVLVTGSYLGTFSHTLTALEALKAKHLKPAGVIISQSAESATPLPEIQASLQHHIPEGCKIIAVPRISLDPDVNTLKDIPDLTVFFDL
ncbi:MAG: dethiobiotin synthase [Rickettsiales bacterium]